MPTILLTGANRGLGLEFTKQYAADGWTVIACCRDPQSARDLQAAAQEQSDIRVEQLDIGDHASIDSLAVKLKGTAIDVLLNNAGTYGAIGFAEGGLQAQSFGTVDYDNWRYALDINTLAPMKMAESFVEHVAASDRKIMATISSNVGSISQSGGGHYAYGSSKAAVNFVMSALKDDLADRGITCLALHPGWVQTDMGGEAAPVTTNQSISGLRQVIDTASLADSGSFRDFEGGTVGW